MAVGSLIYDDITMAQLRTDLCNLSLLVIRERCLTLLEVITDLCFYTAEQLSVGGSVYEMARLAILDVLYGGDSYRPRKFFSLCNFYLLYYVGYRAPITYCTDSLSGLLASAQALVPDIVDLFSLNYYLKDSRIRDELKTSVLPFLQARFLPVTLMEAEFGNLICVTQPGEEPAVIEDGSQQPM